VEDLGQELTDWAMTAGAMAQLDLVISVDTSCAQLAGALGRPVWTVLPALPGWQWGLEGSATPWYETTRLFRARRAGEWPPVFREVAAALAERSYRSVGLAEDS
jgi:ADP-heptose:LPS heptosyltransferase